MACVVLSDMASGNGHIEVMNRIKKQLEGDPRFEKLLNGLNESLNSPLHWATLNNQLSSIAFLLECNASTGLKNTENQTALDMALDLGHYEAAVN